MGAGLSLTVVVASAQALVEVHHALSVVVLWNRLLLRHIDRVNSLQVPLRLQILPRSGRLKLVLKQLLVSRAQ